jgi:hypothetical protein
MPGFNINVINPDIMLINVNIIDKDFNITDFKKNSCIKIKLIKNIAVGVKHIKKFFALKI